jgi:hypothetical protein
MVEQNIGRYLTRHEVVYHIDGDDLNNQLDNLMLFDDLKAKAFHVSTYRLLRKSPLKHSEYRRYRDNTYGV